MKGSPILSVIVCTHNPRADYFTSALDSIRAQQPLRGNAPWELLVIDNASSTALGKQIDLSWHPDARIVREETLGLSYARLRSFHESRGAVLVYIDDDNVLSDDYLRLTMAAFDADEKLGAVGGKSIPRWEKEPPGWFASVGISLACRDLGERRIEAQWIDAAQSDRHYPACAPIGAGMALRRQAYASYVEAALNEEVRMRLGRRGSDLSSGEDNDMILSILAQGWKVAYLPELELEHLIPAGRLEVAYLERYAQSSNRTWVQVLAIHDICPWTAIPKWSVPLRKARAWLHHRPWHGPANRIMWRAACGNFEGRAAMTRIEAAR